MIKRKKYSKLCDMDNLALIDYADKLGRERDKLIFFCRKNNLDIGKGLTLIDLKTTNKISKKNSKYDVILERLKIIENKL